MYKEITQLYELGHEQKIKDRNVLTFSTFETDTSPPESQLELKRTKKPRRHKQSISATMASATSANLSMKQTSTMPNQENGHVNDAFSHYSSPLQLMKTLLLNYDDDNISIPQINVDNNVNNQRRKNNSRPVQENARNAALTTSFYKTTTH